MFAWAIQAARRMGYDGGKAVWAPGGHAVPKADVTVLGAGIIGLSIAWTCLGRGARVRVIDPGGPGAGASGGVVGALAPHVPENWNEKKAFQFESLLMAESFWEAVRDASGISPGYARLGRLQPAPDGAGLRRAHERAESARKLWRGRAIWEVADAPAGDWGPVNETGQVIRDTLSARIHPRRACAALAAAIAARGGMIAAAGAAEGAVVHATGVAGLEEMSRALGRGVGVGVRGQGALLDHAAPEMPQIFADGLHVVPHEDGTTAVGSTTERDPLGEGEAAAALDAVIARAVGAVPALRGAAVIARWAGTRPRARSRAPMLGAHPLHPGEFVANGGFKIGFGMAPKIAETMADLVLEGADHVPESFRPEASM